VYTGTARAGIPGVSFPSVVRRLVRSVVLLSLVALATPGCVVVHAHQRENLAKRSMTNDEDVGDSRFQAHARGAREGAEGGTGQPGGGCGCN
jgi:hypothetical protein